MELSNLSGFSDKLRTLINARYKTNADFYRAFEQRYHFSIESSCKQWLKGNNYPKIDNLIYLCNILDCDFEYFLTDQEEIKRTDKNINDLLGLSPEAIKTLERMDAEHIELLNFIMQDSYCFNVLISQIKNYISGNYDTPIYFERLKDGKSISPPKIGIDIVSESPITSNVAKQENHIYIQNSNAPNKEFITIPVSMTKTYFIDCIREVLNQWQATYNKTN